MAVNTLRPKKNPSPKSKPPGFGPAISLNAEKRASSMSALPTLNGTTAATPFAPRFVAESDCGTRGQ